MLLCPVGTSVIFWNPAMLPFIKIPSRQAEKRLGNLYKSQKKSGLRWSYIALKVTLRKAGVGLSWAGGDHGESKGLKWPPQREALLALSSPRCLREVRWITACRFLFLPVIPTGNGSDQARGVSHSTQGEESSSPGVWGVPHTRWNLVGEEGREDKHSVLWRSVLHPALLEAQFLPWPRIIK